MWMWRWYSCVFDLVLCGKGCPVHLQIFVSTSLRLKLSERTQRGSKNIHKLLLLNWKVRIYYILPLRKWQELRCILSNQHWFWWIHQEVGFSRTRCFIISSFPADPSMHLSYTSPLSGHAVNKWTSMHGMIRNEFISLTSSAPFPGEYGSVWSVRRLTQSYQSGEGWLGTPCRPPQPAGYHSLMAARVLSACQRWLRAARLRPRLSLRPRLCLCVCLPTQMLNTLNTCL